MQAGCTVLPHRGQKGQSYAGPVDEKRAPRLGQVALGGGELLPRHHAIFYDVAQARARSTARFHVSYRSARSYPRHRRRERALEPQWVLGQRVERAPEAGAEPGEIGGAEDRSSR